MTRLLLRLLETWTGRRFVALNDLLTIADPASECGRLIRAWVIKTRREVRR